MNVVAGPDSLPLERYGGMMANQFCRDAGRLVFEMFGVPCGSFSDICEDIVRAFHLAPEYSLFTGRYTLAQSFHRDGQSVELKWDTWTGFAVVANDPVAEELVREIAAHLQMSSWAELLIERE